MKIKSDKVSIIIDHRNNTSSNPHLFSNIRLEHDFDIWGQNTVDNQFNWIWYMYILT